MGQATVAGHPDTSARDALRVPFVVVIRSKGGPSWAPRAASVLTGLGAEVSRPTDGRLSLDRRSVLWLQGNANWYPQVMRQLAALPESERPFVVVWHVEPLPMPAAANLPRQRLHARELAKIALRDLRATDPGTNARRLLGAARDGVVDLIVVTSRGKQEYLAERGLDSECIPLGWDSEVHGDDRGYRRDADVVFLGANDVPRRKRLLRQLRRSGVDVEALGSWKRPVGGEERVELLNRTKILLNLSRHPGQFSGDRLTVGMANGALVISEPMYRPEPFVPDRHYIEAPASRFPELVARYLADDAERERIAVRAHAFVTREDFTFTRSVTRIVELIGQRLAQRGR